MLAAVAAALVLAGCGTGTSGVRDEGPSAVGANAAVSPAAAAATGSAPVVPAAPAPGTAFVYLLRFDQPMPVRRAIPIELSVPEGSMRALLSGPTPAEGVLDYSSAIPAGSKVLGFTIADRIAIVDLSEMPATDGGEEDALLALYQIVYTLTGSEGVDAVRVRENGRPYGLNRIGGGSSAEEPPLTRADLSFVVDAATASGSAGCEVAKKTVKGATPAIAISKPAAGQQVKGQIDVRGVVAGPGGPVVLRLLKDQLEVANRIIDERCRGAFSASIPVPRGLVGPVELVAIAPGADGAAQVSATQSFAVAG